MCFTKVDLTLKTSTMKNIFYMLLEFIGVKKFRLICLSFVMPFLVGSLQAQTGDECIQPFVVYAEETTTTSAEIFWFSFSGESKWEIAYGKEGFEPGGQGSTSIVVSDDMTYTINDLEPSTRYELSIRTICSESNKSEWSPKYRFSTKCLGASIPFTEDFETGYQNYGLLDGCWQHPEYSSNTWGVIEDLSSYNLYPRSGKMFAYMTPGEATVFHPLELVAGKKYKIALHAAQSSSSDVRIKVAYGLSMEDVDDMEAIIDENEIPNSAYQEFAGHFTPNQSGTYFIGIRGYIETSNTFLAIDDISITEAAGCLDPNSLKTDFLSSNTAEVSWKKSGQETQWEVIYGQAGFNPGETGSQTISVSNTPETTITNLEPSTSYEFYVKAICSSSNHSSLIGPVKFTTFCEPLETPYFEDFDNISSPDLPACVSTISSTSISWQTQNFGATGFTGNVLLNMSFNNDSKDWFFSPGIKLEKGKTYELSYKYAVSSTTDQRNLRVVYGSYPNKDMNTQLAFHEVENEAAISNAVYFNVSNSDVYFIGFETEDIANSGFLYIDDIGVKEVTTCLPPTDLKISNVTTNTISTTWTANNNETQWKVVYGVKGFTPGDVNSDSMVIKSSPSVTISNLIPNEQYDIYVKAICDGNIESGLVGPLTISTLCNATSIPYVQDFGEVTFPELPPCSRTETISGRSWETYLGLFYGFEGNVLQLRSHATKETDAWYFTRGLQLKAGENYVVSIEYTNGYTNSTEQLRLSYGSSPFASAMSNEITTYTINTTDIQTSETQFNVSSDGIYYIGLQGYSDASEGAIVINTIKVTSCPQPEDLEVIEINDHSAKIKWEAGGTESKWEVIYGKAGFNLNGVDAQSLVLNSKNTTISNLAGNTEYEFYVRAICSDSDSSNFVGPISFITHCGAMELPYAENFENTALDSLPECASIETVSGNEWEVAQISDFGFNGKVLRYQASTNQSANSWYFTPGIHLKKGETYAILYEYGKDSKGSEEQLKVALGNSPLSSSMTKILAEHTINNTDPVNIFESFEVSSTGTYYFGFSAQSSANQGDLYIDNIEINLAPTCASTGWSSTLLNPSGIASICEDDTIELTVIGSEYLKWSTEETTNSIVVSPSTETTYTVEALGYNGCLFRDTVTVKILNLPPPAAVTNMMPADGSTDLGSNITLSWTPSPDANLYDLYVWQSGESKPETPTIENLSTISTNFVAENGKEYFWQVYSKNACQYTEGDIQSFSTINLSDLSLDSLVAPQVTIGGNTISVTWRVTNVGTGPTGSESWKDFIYLSGSSAISSSSIELGSFKNLSHLRPGESYIRTETVDIPVTIVGGYNIVVASNISIDDCTGPCPNERGGFPPKKRSLKESDFTNNYIKDTISIEAISAPDLIVDNIGVPSDAFGGDEVVITYSVKNNSPIIAGGKWKDVIYFSKEKEFDIEKAIPLASLLVLDTLSQDESYTEQPGIQIPFEFYGDYWVHVYTNYDGDIFEGPASGNNIKTSDQSINVKLTPPADLVVTAVETPLYGRSGQTIPISYTVESKGVTPKVNKWSDHIYISKHKSFNKDSSIHLSSYDYTEGLAFANGATYTLSNQETLPHGIEGEYYVYIFTDAENDVFEHTFEENNIKRSEKPVYIYLSPYPDLVVESFTIDKDTLVYGEKVKLNWTVRNIGAGATTELWKDRFFIAPNAIPSEDEDKEILVTNSLNEPLKTGELVSRSIEFIIPYHVGLGKKYIYLKTNADESNYENKNYENNYSRSVQVYLKAPVTNSDLMIDQVNIPNSISSSEHIDVSWTVKNIGTDDPLTNNWTDAVFLSQDAEFNPYLDLRLGFIQKRFAMDSTQSYTFTKKIKVPNGLSGNYHLVFVTDYNNSVANDFNRENNIYIQPIDIQLSPWVDLELTSMNIPTSAYAGEEVYIHYSVKNVGAKKLSSFKLLDRVYLSKTPSFNGVKLDFNYSLRDLEVGESYTDSILVVVPEYAYGNYYLVLNIDDNDDVYEHNNKDNNTLAKLITIHPTSQIDQDLEITAFNWPNSLTLGNDVSLSYTIKNKGTEGVVSRLNNALYYSKDQTYQGGTDPLLAKHDTKILIAPGESVQASISGKIKDINPNSYYGIMRANTLNSAPDSDLSNNTTISANKAIIDANELTLDIPALSTLDRGDYIYYKVDVAEGMDLLVKLTSESSLANNQVYVAYNRTPKSSDSDFKYLYNNSADQLVLCPNTQAGAYYIFVKTETAGSQNIEVVAQTLPFSLLDVSPSNMGQGIITSSIEGAGFREGVRFLLRKGSSDYALAEVKEMKSSMSASVLWDLSEVPIGKYDLVAINSDNSEVILSDAINVQHPTGFQLSGQNIFPKELSAAMSITGSQVFKVVMKNNGNIDIPVVRGEVAFYDFVQLNSVEKSGPVYLMDDLIDPEYLDDGDRYTSIDYYKNIPFLAKNLAPGEQFTINFEPSNIVFAPFSIKVEAKGMSVDTYIKKQAEIYEMARQEVLKSHSIELSAYPEALQLLSNSSAYRDSIFSIYIRKGFFTPNDTVGVFSSCQDCGTNVFSPGYSPGLQIITGRSFESSGKYIWEINDPYGSAGNNPGWDLIKTPETLEIKATTNDPFEIDIYSLSSYTGGQSFLTTWEPGYNKCWPIVIADGGITGFNSNKFKINSSKFEKYNQLHGGKFSISHQGDTLFICFNTRTPEIGEDGFAGGPGQPGKVGGRGGKGGDGSCTIAPGIGGAGGEGGVGVPAHLSLTNKEIHAGRGGRGGKGGDLVCFDQQGGVFAGPGGKGGDGGQGGPGQVGGQGGEGGPGGDGGNHAIGGDGGQGGAGGSGTNGGNGGNGGVAGNGSQSGLGGHGGGGGYGSSVGGNGGNGGGSGSGGPSGNGGNGGNGGDGGGSGGDGDVPGGPGTPGGDGDGPWNPNDPDCENCPVPPQIPNDDPPKPPVPPIDPDGPIPPDNPPVPPPPPTPPTPPGVPPLGPISCDATPPPSPQKDICDYMWRNVGCATAGAGCAKTMVKYTAIGAAAGAPAAGAGALPGAAGGAAVGAFKCGLGFLNCATGGTKLTNAIGCGFGIVDFASGDVSGALDCGYLTCEVIPVKISCDPNEIIGPDGTDDSLRFVSVNDTLLYTINFENDSALASAPAQRVTIRQQFDEDVNPFSMRLGTFGFANMTFEVPENSLTYTTRLSLHDTLDFDVEVTAGLDVDKREVFWVFQSIDNSTGRTPYDPSVGFLPINDSISSGEGFVTYTVIPESSSQTGDPITHQASIIFDVNAPIETNIWTNLIDAVAPTSVLSPIDPVQSSTSFTLSWTAQDDLGGSGVKDYDLLFLKDGDNWQVYADAITDTFAVFKGESETTYHFKVLARDRANNLEEKNVVDATVYLLLEKNIQVSLNPEIDAAYCMDDIVEINWTSDLVDSVNIYISTDAGNTYDLIVENIDASLGIYQWLVPQDINLTASNHFKIEDANTSSVFGLSNSFEIHQQPELTVSFNDTIVITSGELMSLEITTTEDDSLITWYRNGVLIASGTKALTISDKGLYTVQVKNEVGCSVSAQTIVLQKLSAHAEILADDSTYVCENSNIELHAVYVEGFTYQWLLNGEEIKGAVEATHTTDIMGTYSVIVYVAETNDVDTSKAVEVIVIPIPEQPTITTDEKTLLSSADTGNQWYANGILIDGATEQAFEPKNSGQYTVMVTDSNGCVSEMSEVKDFVYTMIFESLRATDILMYPNPNEGTFYVSFDVPLNSELTIRLFDLNGREHMKDHYPSYTGKYWEELSIKKPTPGLYFLEVTVGKNKSMVKIIVQ